MDFFIFFLIPTAYQTMHCQSRLKIWYVLFWSYYGPGRLELNRTIKGHPQDVVCRVWLLLSDENFRSNSGTHSSNSTPFDVDIGKVETLHSKSTRFCAFSITNIGILSLTELTAAVPVLSWVGMFCLLYVCRLVQTRQSYGCPSSQSGTI